VRVLVAEDEVVSRTVLTETLTDWHYEVVAVSDGEAALAELVKPDGPRLGLLDWEMPHLTGIEVCQRARAALADPPFLIMLSGRRDTADVVAGLEAGANDYLTKPFQEAELAARLSVAVRTLELQQALADRIAQLEQALAQVRTLRRLLPICGWCKKVRNDQNYWQQVEEYFLEQAGTRFTHGVCPECLEEQTRGG
jgi:sigma-B regulation protein RsbU (phosphoserine phosphatase)